MSDRRGAGFTLVLVHSGGSRMLHLGCPLESKAEQAERGLSFEFLADPPGAPKIAKSRSSLPLM